MPTPNAAKPAQAVEPGPRLGLLLNFAAPQPLTAKSPAR